jgi:hypothetical protein
LLSSMVAEGAETVSPRDGSPPPRPSVPAPGPGRSGPTSA